MSSASDAPTLPMTVVWEQDFGIGNDRLDTQHRHLLDQCNLLAERCLASTGDGVDGAFDLAFTQLVAEVRAHLADESAWLAGRDDADLENHRFECEEFDYLASEVATAGHFDAVELQRFVALWCIGHARGARDLISPPDPSAPA